VKSATGHREAARAQRSLTLPSRRGAKKKRRLQLFLGDDFRAGSGQAEGIPSGARADGPMRCSGAGRRAAGGGRPSPQVPSRS